MSLGMDDPGRYITRPVVIMLFLICVFLYYITPSGKLSEPTDEEEESSSMSRRIKDLQKNNNKEKVIQKEEVEKGPNEPIEFVHGTKRYKLYEKKRLNFKKAEAFCKKMEGRLAKTENLDQMKRLTTLMQRATMLSDELWVSVERKQWKGHEWKDKSHPPGMNPEALSQMNAMMMGGGKEQMCSSLSSATRALSQTMCLREIPFICEFDIAKPPEKVSKRSTPKPPKTRTTSKPKKQDAKAKKATKEKSNNKIRATVMPPPQRKHKSEHLSKRPTAKPGKTRTTTNKPAKTKIKTTSKAKKRKSEL